MRYLVEGSPANRVTWLSVFRQEATLAKVVTNLRATGVLTNRTNLVWSLFSRCISVWYFASLSRTAEF